MHPEEVIKLWFSKWETGAWADLPLDENHKHTGPFGNNKGKRDITGWQEETAINSWGIRL